MIEIDNLRVYNIAKAVYSARNAWNSWDKSDSNLLTDTLGENDLRLAKKLYAAGPVHAKYLRQIFVSFDVTAPLYWIAEHDTYKVGTTRNSCSFQHKGVSKPFELSDFTIDVYEESYDVEQQMLLRAIENLNFLRNMYLQTNDYKYFRLIRQLLPSGYNQRYTWTGSYANLVNIIELRRNHPLKEWREFCEYMLDTCPYLKEIMGE